MDLRPDQTARRGESWRTPSTPRQNRPKVMRTNDRLGDSYRSLAPGLCGRRASRDVSAQDLHDLCSRTNALRLTRFASLSEPMKEAVKCTVLPKTVPRETRKDVSFSVYSANCPFRSTFSDQPSHPSRPGGHIPNHGLPKAGSSSSSRPEKKVRRLLFPGGQRTEDIQDGTGALNPPLKSRLTAAWDGCSDPSV